MFRDIVTLLCTLCMFVCMYIHMTYIDKRKCIIHSSKQFTPCILRFHTVSMIVGFTCEFAGGTGVPNKVELDESA